MIFLTEDRAIFCDGRTIVVGCVTTTLAQIAPVGATVGHVYVEDGDPIAEVVLVEDPGKLRVDECCAAVEARPSPRVDRTALEFEDGVWCAWTLFEVQLAEVGGKTGLSPVGRVGTVPSARIVVMAVDIRTARFSRDEEADCSGLIVD